MSKSFQSETRDWHDWSVTIHAVPESEGARFDTECVSPDGTIYSIGTYRDKSSAWQQSYNFHTPMPGRQFSGC